MCGLTGCLDSCTGRQGQGDQIANLDHIGCKKLIFKKYKPQRSLRMRRILSKRWWLVLGWIVIIILPALGQQGTSFQARLAREAFELTRRQVVYDPAYVVIPYPNGDVPADRGVCTDVVIRAYRRMGIDLQKAVHEDMKAHFDQYPKNWGLSKPDKNIDHRRVPNLMVFFGRFGRTLAKTSQAADYQPGDIVCWNLGGGITHIGIVSHGRSADGQRPMIIHNIGQGQVEEDMLFDYTIIGHFRYGAFGR